MIYITFYKTMNVSYMRYVTAGFFCCFKTGHWRNSLVVWSLQHVHWLQLALCTLMLVQMR